MEIRNWVPIGNPVKTARFRWREGLPRADEIIGDHCYRVLFAGEGTFMAADVFAIRTPGGVLTTMTVRYNPRGTGRHGLVTEIEGTGFQTEDEALESAKVEAELLWAHGDFPEEET